MSSLQQIEAGIRKALRESDTALDVVFAIFRPVRQTPRTIEILLGRQDNALLHTKSLPQGNLGIVMWKGMADVRHRAEQAFAHYFDSTKTYILLSEPYFMRHHESYAKEKKLLVYVRVDLPVEAVLLCRETPNGFCEQTWCNVRDLHGIARHFQTMRAPEKAKAHIEAIELALQLRPLALVS